MVRNHSGPNGSYPPHSRQSDRKREIIPSSDRERKSRGMEWSERMRETARQMWHERATAAEIVAARDKALGLIAQGLVPDGIEVEV